VLADGSVAFSKERIVIDEAFVKAARQGRSPEKRFRFSSTCKRAACIQWTDDKCGIVDRIIVEHEMSHEERAAAESEPFVLPECSIRPQCRWYLQSGETACRACPEVITDTGAEVATPEMSTPEAVAA
jgi:hypothetical protein